MKLNEDEFAKSLMAHERKEWQDPDKIISIIGIDRGMSVADLACGPGFFVGPIADAVGPKGLVYAVDKSSIMLGYLRSILKSRKVGPSRVKVIQADILDTTIPSESCDIILFANILHDVDDIARFASEIKRISKPNSKIVDIDWKDVDTGFGPPLEIRLSEEKSKKLLTGNGLEFVRRVESGPYHYGLAFRKALTAGPKTVN